MNQEFEKNGFIVVRNFFSSETIQITKQYMDIRYNVAKFTNQDKSVVTSDVAESYAFYGDTLCESILLNHGQKISNLLGLNLSPTYAFARAYEKGDTLIPHKDRGACEISATCPVYISDGKPSVLYISKFTTDRFDEEPRPSLDKFVSGDYYKAELYPGDVLFYKGCKHYHWRDALESPLLFQFFMHFVQTEGKYKELVFDTRPLMGLPASYKTKKVLDL